MIPFATFALVTTGPIVAPENTVLITLPEMALTTPPRLALGPTDTVAAWLRLIVHKVPVDPGIASATLGSHRVPNSNVTPAEFRPGKVPFGSSPATANGVYSLAPQFAFVPALTVM